ncbi:MAG: hypothetical protein V5A62_05235 [Haloarculaceae archaeon]
MFRAALAALFSLVLGSVLLVGPALAHGGSLRSAPPRSLSVPLWLFLATGGGIVGASFLLASFVTDRAFVRLVHEWRRVRSLPAADLLIRVGNAVGVLGLVAVVGVGLFGPADPLRNLGVLVVWVGWWAGFAMTTYLVGNTWPALNPWRTIARYLPSLDRPYPERLESWPAVVGLLGLVWLEVVSPLADDPRLLAGVVLAYTTVTLAGCVAFGREAWFDRVDPVSRVFRYYGAVAPLHRDGDGVALRIPGTGLEDADLVTTRSEVAFVVALLWVTTYDGLVATPPWRDFATALVDLGVPAVLLYPAALLVGFGVFYGAFRLAIRSGRRRAETYLPTSTLARRFAPSLLAIAAGYHVAHYLGYLIELSPTLLGALVNPLAPPSPVAVVLPGWFQGVALAFVLLGHLVAIWVAHATSFELFPGRIQAVRSQYALTLVMVFYTMTSLLIVSRPYAAPPFV